ncbi:metalloaminopeptidase APE1 NDAI_0K02710 [Naumovozyma dairenensis CBS 421]|uniref:Uncharacterized protein n=1 Tax=Naumovozyma dairenensis (strain ATCC 10597 / BCRC 20456 / CBS 421 / NBRC 0211 / NRRL Y-12639) TaxID=1071378 RepID=G0WI51_NAUDC|nr:hypothetical protein NDAI_0K02710 [Naumovozyma dairenensis CBS 421]CCD27462.1 hypothetical protein NDAI_0K02710 [Naumovozyma dairenensis CBS 421]
MEEQREILDQLKKTLEMLTMDATEKSTTNTSSSASSTTSSNNATISNDDYVSIKHTYEDCAQEFINFQYKNPTTYHVVDHISNLLLSKGFKYLCEKGNWDACANGSKGGKFFTVRNGSNLVAWIVGDKWQYKRGVGAVASHIDSLTVKLKPVSTKENVGGYEMLGVAPYGGTLNEAWLDRDLGIAGRVYIRTPGEDEIKAVLIDSTPHPIAKIPSLAPHFGKPSEGPFDKEDQMVPVIGFTAADDDDEPPANEKEKTSPLYGKHPIKLLRYVAKLANVKVCQLIQLDLDLFDVQKGTLGGLNNEFIFAPRVDDRLCSFAAAICLAHFAENLDIANMETFNAVALFDNEEIGSLSRQGAKGGLLESVVGRVATARNKRDVPPDMRTLFANSIILSADVNHLFNPNFKDVYLKDHAPKPNYGITLSLDPNGHMATDSVGVTFIEELARGNNDKVQYFQIKNNSRSGGTIGPSLACQTGARTIDLGIAQLSMHSIRAATGTRDVGLGIKFFRNFFDNWRTVYDKFADL